MSGYDLDARRRNLFAQVKPAWHGASRDLFDY